MAARASRAAPPSTPGCRPGGQLGLRRPRWSGFPRLGPRLVPFGGRRLRAPGVLRRWWRGRGGGGRSLRPRPASSHPGLLAVPSRQRFVVTGPLPGRTGQRGRRPLDLVGRQYIGKSCPHHPPPEMGTPCFPWTGHEPGPPSQRRCVPALSRSRRVPGAGVRPRPPLSLAAIFTTVGVLGALTQPQFRDLGRVRSRRRSPM